MVWGYAKENGPTTWASMFPIAKGTRQSPIDIKCGSCHCDNSLRPIQVAYSDIRVSELSNTGHAWKAQIGGGSSKLTGGPLGGDEYVLEQFHCHWGKTNDTGSEHTVDGRMYAAELHLVHWNKTKFPSFAAAAAADNGLAVLGMFLTAGRTEHPELSKISKLLPFIQHKGQAISVSDVVCPENYLPSSRSFWTYPGSLTTPPLYESVTWIVFEDAIEVSQAQLDAFRAMKSYHPSESCPEDELAGCLVENYRPPCPTGERIVRVFKDKMEEE